MNEALETIKGKNLLDKLQEWIETRRFCKVEIPNTSYGWISIIVSLQRIEDSYHLWMDQIKGFEKVISSYSPNQEILIAFVEKDGVTCQFRTRVIEYLPRTFRVALPDAIYRRQRRRFFRIKAKTGTEIAFHLKQGEEGRAMVRDYGLGGLAFLVDPHHEIQIGEELLEMDLMIPEGEETLHFPIPKGLVKRMERLSFKKEVCALEFIGISEAVQEQLMLHIFKEQRAILRKTGKI